MVFAKQMKISSCTFKGVRVQRAEGGCVYKPEEFTVFLTVSKKICVHNGTEFG